VAFTLGAATGAAGFAWWGLFALAVPAVLCFLLAAHFSRQYKQAHKRAR